MSDVEIATKADVQAEADARAAADALLIPLAQKAAASGVATLDSDSKIPVVQLPATYVPLAGNATKTDLLTLPAAVALQIGADGQDPGNANTVRFPLATGVGARYGMRHNVGVFDDGGGIYNDGLLQIGYNLDHETAGEPSSTLNFEHKYRQGAGGKFNTETIFSWISPDGTIGRRPYQFAVEYPTGNVDHSFAGKVSWFNSASTTQKMIMEDGGPLRLIRSTLVMARDNADTAAFWQVERTESVVLAAMASDGSLGLGGGPDGEGRLYIKGTNDMSRLFFVNQTNNKRVFFGCLASYGGGDLVADGAGCYFRVKHTTGHFYTKVPNAVPINKDFVDVNSSMTAYVDEAASTLKWKVRLSTGLYKTGSVALV